MFIIGACGKSTEPKALSIDSPRNLSIYQSLGSMRVKELFIVIFEKDFSEEEWKLIFDETQELSLNKKKLREVEGQDTEAVQNLRSDIMGRNAQLILNLSMKSLFMLSWSLGDENCTLSSDVQSLACRPFNLDNPLNGGLPKSLEPLIWVNPNPVTDEVKSPYLKLRLGLDSGAAGARYALTLRMKPERVGSSEKWFKGDAIPDPGSRFLKPAGGFSQGFYPYGYAELTLEK